MSRSAVDRLGERLKQPGDPGPEDLAAYDEYRAGFEPALSEVLALCLAEAGDALAWSARLKTVESVIAKLRRGTFKLSQVQDIAGCRAELPGRVELDATLEKLTQGGPLATVRVTDYRLASHCGYRAVHLIARSGTGQLVEVQLRTAFQNTWALTSERLAAAHGIEVKYCGGPPEVRNALDSLSSAVQYFDELRSRATVDQIRLREMIMVFRDIEAARDRETAVSIATQSRLRAEGILSYSLADEASFTQYFDNLAKMIAGVTST